MNVSVLKMVVGILGAVLVVDAVGMVLLTLQDRGIPGVLENVMLMGIAGLLGLLAPSKDVVADKVVNVDGRHEAGRSDYALAVALVALVLVVLVVVGALR